MVVGISLGSKAQNTQQEAELCLFSDDTSATLTSSNRETLELKVFLEGNSISQWFSDNLLKTNLDKTSLIEFSIGNRNEYGLKTLLGNNEIDSSDCIKFLGVFLDKNLKFHDHINYVSKKAVVWDLCTSKPLGSVAT